jgi:hypothetical protein
VTDGKEFRDAILDLLLDVCNRKLADRSLDRSLVGCVSCKRGIEPNWDYCPFCGKQQV